MKQLALALSLSVYRPSVAAHMATSHFMYEEVCRKAPPQQELLVTFWLTDQNTNSRIIPSFIFIKPKFIHFSFFS
jgi:hypothetical protein